MGPAPQDGKNDRNWQILLIHKAPPSTNIIVPYLIAYHNTLKKYQTHSLTFLSLNVIGTLWEVNDELRVEMASITYKKMRDKGVTGESVC